MRGILVVLLVVFCAQFKAQKFLLSGKITDESQTEIPGVRIKNLNSNKNASSDGSGKFGINVEVGDRLQFSLTNYDTLNLLISKELITNKLLEVSMRSQVMEINEVNITRKRMEGFDVGYLPALKGVQINTGTNAVIELSGLSGAKSTANPREIFAKVPGLNIWESDGAGIQVGIGGRGLSPDRAANFNTRQNGYDISADALGYPESYYTPPIEALKSIEIIRGSASLQFGTQFGGLLNFVIKDPETTTPFHLTSRLTGGTYGYLGTFNRISGTKNKFAYQVYHQFKRGNGYRQNSGFYQHQFFGQMAFQLTEKQLLKLEYTQMNYLTQQPGGLTDLQFENDIRQSFRNRNWFAVDWKMLALHYDFEVTKSALINVRAFGMLSDRKSLGFLEKITKEDIGGPRTMILGEFKNIGAETRFLKRYELNSKIKGAFLVGARYYRGFTTAEQGNASSDSTADFSFTNPSNLENSSYEFPSENIAGFIENILFLNDDWRFNFGMRYEYITSSSEGFYKQYVIHPVNFDTIAIYTNESERFVKRSLPLFGFGLSKKIMKRGTVYANTTQNYRAINFTDIRVTNPNFIVDTLMKDEYGVTVELGTRGLLSNFFIYDIALYYLYYGDKIGLAPKLGTIYKERTNIGDARNMGIEIFAEIDFLKMRDEKAKNGFSWFVNAAYTNAVYIRSRETSYVGKQVEYVSPIIVKSGLKFKTAKLTMQIQGSFNSAQFTDATNSVEPSGDAVIGQIPAYFVGDFSGRYDVSELFKIELGVNNFTNSKYYTRRAVSYPGPGILPSDGINAYITLQFQLKAGKKK